MRTIDLSPGMSVGIHWLDVTSYDSSVKKPEPSHMYTEGEVFFSHHDFVIVCNPETLTTNAQGTFNHPEEKPHFYGIPRGLIQTITIYE